MTRPATLYVTLVILAGFAAMTAALAQWEFTNSSRLLAYLVAAMLASTFKMRLPGVTGTLSPGFLFVLVAIAEFSLTEAVGIAVACALTQSLWWTKQRPRVEQVLFNVSLLAVVTAVCQQITRASWPQVGTNSLTIVMVVAVCLYYLGTTAGVAAVLSLLQEGRFRNMYKFWSVTIFPYYLVGAAIAGLATLAVREGHWQSSLRMLPLMILVHVCYRPQSGRAHADRHLVAGA